MQWPQHDHWLWLKIGEEVLWWEVQCKCQQPQKTHGQSLKRIVVLGVCCSQARDKMLFGPLVGTMERLGSVRAVSRNLCCHQQMVYTLIKASGGVGLILFSQ